MECPNCGGEVPAKKVGQVGQPKTYCSIKCRNTAQGRRARGKAESWDRSDRKCSTCGGSFSPKTKHHAYCSVTCRSKGDNLRRFGGSGSNSNYYRTAFLEERGGVCQRCGVPDGLEIHHVITVAAGGSHEASNLLVVCKACHGNEHRSSMNETPTLSRAEMFFRATQK